MSQLSSKIIVLSDIDGWNGLKLRGLNSIRYLDTRVLGNVDLNQPVHKQFVAGGIDHAAKNLLNYSAEIVVGISIGGIIAWKAALHGLTCQTLVCLSATRLRFETNKPECDIHLFFGANDPYLPDPKWMKEMNVPFTKIPNEGHEFYKNQALESGFIRVIRSI